MGNLIKTEPVMFQAIIQAVLTMIISFGIHLSNEQMGIILVFTAAILAFWTRQQVTSHPNNPSRNPSLQDNNAIIKESK